jgi:hypothetical protein
MLSVAASEEIRSECLLTDNFVVTAPQICFFVVADALSLYQHFEAVA